MSDPFQPCFATIWIFARLRRHVSLRPFIMRFATIWIFARLRLVHPSQVQEDRFATIWIFARLRHRSTFLVLQYSDW